MYFFKKIVIFFHFLVTILLTGGLFYRLQEQHNHRSFYRTMELHTLHVLIFCILLSFFVRAW